MTPQDLWEFAKPHLGAPYIWGADGPSAFDCSGFAQFLLAHMALDPKGDQTVNGLYQHFSDPKNGTAVSLADAHCGTLVFYGTAKSPGHIVMCLTPELMIEAGGGGSETITIDIAHQMDAKVRVRKILRRHDVIGLRRPVHLPWPNTAPDPVLPVGIETV